jgi:hypothetical protein
VLVVIFLGFQLLAACVQGATTKTRKPEQQTRSKEAGGEP